MRVWFILCLWFLFSGFTPEVQALMNVRPGAAWNWSNPSDYSTLVWLDQSQSKPSANEIATETAYVKSISSVPQTVSSVQAKVALLRAGLLTTVQNWVNSQDAETQLVWNTTPGFSRNSGLIAKGGAALGLTRTQLDQLFITAATINP